MEVHPPLLTRSSLWSARFTSLGVSYVLFLALTYAHWLLGARVDFLHETVSFVGSDGNELRAMKTVAWYSFLKWAILPVVLVFSSVFEGFLLNRKTSRSHAM
jgi:hypothetical protein